MGTHSANALRNPRFKAFTLVELLVVIAIIGILVALLLPAIQSAREAARRTQCVNHLKQLSLGCMNHEGTHKYFPSGGWGTNWVGDADRGSGAEQPGSWLYNVLPFIEEQALHDMPKDGQAATLNQPQLDGALRMVGTPGPVTFHCPSRRPAVLYKVESHHVQYAKNGTRNSSPTDFYVGANDYASNTGDGTFIDSEGANSWAEGINPGPSFDAWTLFTSPLGLQKKPADISPKYVLTGVMFQRSEVGTRAIPDGTSNTYLLGERYVSADAYNRDLVNDDGSPYAQGGDSWGWPWGFSADVGRSALKPPAVDFPRAEVKEIFGSAHPGAFHMAFSDGHVEGVSYDIDLLIHQQNANRLDGGIGN